jgi:phosphate transport system protein
MLVGVTRTLDPRLEELRGLILRMGSLAERILEKAYRAAAEGRATNAEEIQQEDIEIDRLDVEIDESVLRVLALQAPVADELRWVIATKTMATDLERVGDLARNIAKCGRRLAERDGLPLPPKLTELADEARRLLRAALDAYTHNDAGQARAVLEGDDRVDRLQDRVIEDALSDLVAGARDPRLLIDVIQIAKSLERVADHATNIAEDVILVAEALNVKHADKLSARSR